MTVEIFIRIVWTVFEKIEKWRFFGHFWLILAMFLTPHPYDFDVIAHIGFYYDI